MTYVRTGGALLALVLLSAGCGPAPSREAANDAATPSSSGQATPPKASKTAMAMLPKLQAHLDSVAADPGMLKGSMSSHEAEVKAVVEAMHADMMAAGMHSDAAYEALADSVVKGSAALGTASGPEFERQVKEHVDRTRRLTAAYESKAGAM